MVEKTKNLSMSVYHTIDRGFGKGGLAHDFEVFRNFPGNFGGSGQILENFEVFGAFLKNFKIF